jgi:hypothetical protein
MFTIAEAAPAITGPAPATIPPPTPTPLPSPAALQVLALALRSLLQDPATARSFLQQAGFIDATGQLIEPYQLAPSAALPPPPATSLLDLAWLAPTGKELHAVADALADAFGDGPQAQWLRREADRRPEASHDR